MPMFSNVSRNSLSKAARSDLNRSNNSSIFESDGQVGGKVVSYGSYKLSVVDKESDLDLLCVVPKHVSREDFFTNLYDQLFKKVISL